MTVAVPSVPGVLSMDQVRSTAAAIARVQQPDGGIPWSVGAHVDAWNHVEAAMAMLVGGEVDAAHAAYDWCVRTQRPDGSWPMKTVGDRVEDPSGDTNISAYLAVGVWHHWLVRRDPAFVRAMWPSVRAGLDFVARLQLPWGGIAWSQSADGQVAEEALLAGCSSIDQALRAGLALAELLDEPQPEWELVGGRLRHALRAHLDRFLDKRTFSMDWYYPVLGGALRDAAGVARLAERWDDFVVDGIGARCVDTNPWVTAAETCELVLALDAVGDTRRAHRLFGGIQRLRHEEGLYWTGLVFDEDVFWPEEQTTYTAGAVVLAADALSRTTGGSGVFRGDGLVEALPPLALECGCAVGESSLSVR